MFGVSDFAKDMSEFSYFPKTKCSHYDTKCDTVQTDLFTNIKEHQPTSELIIHMTLVATEFFNY